VCQSTALPDRGVGSEGKQLRLCPNLQHRHPRHTHPQLGRLQHSGGTTKRESRKVVGVLSCRGRTEGRRNDRAKKMASCAVPLCGRIRECQPHLDLAKSRQTHGPGHASLQQVVKLKNNTRWKWMVSCLLFLMSTCMWVSRCRCRLDSGERDA